MRMFSLFLAVALALAAGVGDASARPVRVTTRTATVEKTTCAGGVCQTSSATTESVRVSGPIAGVVVTTEAATTAGAQEALDEVNAARAARGLPPFVRDDGLTQAALTIATQRASRRIAGHTANDFSGLPPGVSARAAGCAAWPPSLGWGSCCTYDRYTHAGAAWAIGGDGRRYMQLFVR